MAFIYKIENKINGKVYIGQTKTPLNQRMNKHYSRAKNEKKLTGIDAAIKKYGRDNFTVEILDECSEDELDELERFYIAKYDSYNNGYNLTRGGQDGIGSQKELNYDEVIFALENYKTIKKAATYLKCGERTLSNFMKANNIPHYYVNSGRVENILGKGKPFKEGDRAKKVCCIELDKTFNSLKECSEWLLTNGYTKATSTDAVRKSLSRHLNGERQSYLKMHFKFI